MVKEFKEGYIYIFNGDLNNLPDEYHFTRIKQIFKNSFVIDKIMYVDDDYPSVFVKINNEIMWLEPSDFNEVNIKWQDIR